MEIQWTEEEEVASAGNEKYPPVLQAIREVSLDNGTREWAVLNEMTNEPSARDLASRLGRSNPDFDIVSRKRGDVTVVYARLKEGVNE